MRYLEVRRHTMRIKPNKHICQTGVMLARRIGDSMGPFDRVITSDAPRAFETAIAMGFAVDEQLKELAAYNDDVTAEVENAVDCIAFARAIKGGGAAARFAKRQAKLWRSIVDRLENGGRALIITHGGIVEMGAIGCLPDADHAAWGASFDYCEGLRLSYDGREFIEAEVLRAS